MTFPLSGLVAGVVDVVGVAGLLGLWEGLVTLGEAVFDADAEGGVSGFTAGLQAVRANVLKVINPNTLDMILPLVRGRWTNML